MKYEEYVKLAEEAANPDKTASSLKAILDGIKNDTEVIANLNKAVSEKDSRIRDLQDTNMKLFLAQTGKQQEAAEDEKSETLDDFVKAFTEGWKGN